MKNKTSKTSKSSRILPASGFLMILLLSSCINEYEAEKTGTDSVRVSLQFYTEASGTRSTGTLPGAGNDQESKVNRVTVGVFDSQDRTVTVHEQSVSVLTENGITFNTTPAASKVLVTANAPEGWFDGQSTLSGFTGRAADLAYTTDAVGNSKSSAGTADSQQCTSLPMYGTLTFLTGESTKTVEGGIVLSRMVARIALGRILTDLTGLYAGASFIPEEVFLYNANTSCNWDGTYTASLVSGESTTSSTSASGVTTLTFYPNEASFLSTGKSTFTADAVKGTLSSPLYFYVFPNGATTPTKLVIKGIWKDDAGLDASVVVYYPVIVNHSQRGTTLVSGGVTYADGADYAKDKTVEGNVQYSLGATIHSKGVTSLSQEVSPSAVSLTVSVGAWSTTSQEVIFD